MSSDNPFRIKDKKYDIDEDTVEKIIKKRLNRKPKGKPVKFTWEGLTNLAHLFDTNIFSPHKLARIKELMEGRDEAKEKDYIDFFEDIEKGVYSGTQKLGYSIGDIATTGIDLGTAFAESKGYGKRTELTEKLTEIYEENKMKESETLVGKTTEVLTQFGIPGSAGFKIMNRIKRLSGIQKLRAGTATAAATVAGVKWGARISNIANKSGYMAGSFAIMDYLGSEPDRGNLFFKKEDTENLTGSDLAVARFNNRLRFAAEGATIGTFWPLLGAPAKFGLKWGLLKPLAFTAGVGLKTANTLVVQPASWLLSKDKYLIPNISKGIRKGTTFTSEKIFNPIIQIGIKDKVKELPKFSEWRKFAPGKGSADPLKGRLKTLDNIFSWFRSVGKMTGNRYNLTSRARREIKARSRTIEKWLESIDYTATQLAKSFRNQYNTSTTSPASQSHYLDQVLTYLKGDLRLDQLPKLLQNSSKNLKGELGKIKKTFAELLPESDLKKFMLANVSNYMRKSFAVFTNPAYQPEKQIFEGAVGYMENVIKNNRDLRAAALQEFKNFKPVTAVKKHAETLVRKILHEGKNDAKDPLEILKYISKTQLRSKNLVRTGEELPTAIKRLLGDEVKKGKDYVSPLKSSVLFTTSHAITQTVTKKLSDRLAALGIKEGWLFKDEARANARGILDAEKIHHVPDLGFLGSKLDKLYASKQIANAFRGTPGKLDGAIQNSAYRALLQLKVATQFGKTVLSPATQVRNVTSASLFPLANGHIGGRASVSEAFKMTLDDIFGAGTTLDERALITNIEDKIRRGVIDENIVASELGAVLQDIKKGSINTLDGLYNKLTNSKFMKTATRVYAGGDNVWKWFGDEYVQSQLRSTYKDLNALKAWFPEIQGQNFIVRDTFTNSLKTYDDAIKEAASWYIRNTYPTYSKVPEVIKAIRKLPFGNFVSFPAEMMRTSFNIMNIAGKEISSSNALLRQIGYRRMIGAYTVLSGAGTAALNIASSLTGVTLEELDAYKRSFAAPWNKNSILLPMDKWIKGKGKAINFSYFSPYDVVQRPFEAFFAALGEGKKSNKEWDDLTLSVMGDTFSELFDSFVSEPIGYERIIDVLPRGKFGRGGQKKAGGFVYSETDSPSDIWNKSFSHILEGIEPGVMTTGGKIKSAIESDIKPGGQPYSLRDEALALFSGIRIIDVNVPKSLEYNITDYQRGKRAVTKTEAFYSLENALNRGPSTMANEFRSIQDEAFRVQQEFYYVIQDALEMGMTKRDLRKIMKKRNVGKREIAKLFRGKFTPFNYSKPLMEKRWREAKEAYKGENPIKSYFYPRSELNRVIREYRNKSLKYEEPGESMLNKIKNAIISRADAAEPEKISSVPIDFSGVQTTRMQTPPLPLTPQPKQMAGLASLQVNPTTGLTRTEAALLSPGEQAIRQGQRRV